MYIKEIIYAASWLILAATQSITTTEQVFLVRNLDGSQGLCTLDATISFTRDLGFEMDFESNACSDMQTFYFFVANATRSITEVRLNRNSSVTLNQYEAPYKVLSSTHQIDLKQSLTIGSTFKGHLSLGLDHTPVNPTRYNLAVLMTEDPDPVCADFLSYYILINAPISLPDLMVLDKYKVIGLNQ